MAIESFKTVCRDVLLPEKLSQRRNFVDLTLQASAPFEPRFVREKAH